MLIVQQQQAVIQQARMAAVLKLQQPYLQAHPHLPPSQQTAVIAAAALAQQQQAQAQQRFEKNSPPNTVTGTQPPPNLMEAFQYQRQSHQQQGLLSRHPGGPGTKVGGAPFGNDLSAAIHQPHHQHMHSFQQQLKSQAAFMHPQHRVAPQTHAMMPHPPPPSVTGVEPNQTQQQQLMERQQREVNAESTKSGLSISAIPFIPTSNNTPPTTRKFTSAPNVGDGIPPPPPRTVSAVSVGVGGHVTRPSAPLLQHVVLPGHMVPTPPAPPPPGPGGMLPIPPTRPHPQQMHVGNNHPQFLHPIPRKTSVPSVGGQGQSLLGGPAYQVIDKPHHPTGTVSRQLSGEGATLGGGASKPPPGLSLPIRPNVISELGTTPSGMMAGLDLQARTMAVNRSGHALANTTPMTVDSSYTSVRPQNPHHQLHELPSLYGAPPKIQPNVATGGNKRALLPTPTAAIPGQLNFLTGGSHHITVAPAASLPPGIQNWSGGTMRVPPHRVPPPPSVTINQNSHRQQQAIYTQEQVVQRSNYGGGYNGRGNGRM